MAIVAGCATAATMPPMPHDIVRSPKDAEFQLSLGTKMMRGFRPLLKMRLAAPLPPSALVITNVAVADGVITLNWQSGINVQVQSSTDLENWIDIGQPTTNQTAAFATVGDIQFYRLRELGPILTPGEAQIQRMFGGIPSMGSSGIIPNKIAVDSAGNVVIAGLMYYTVNAGAGEMATYGGQDAVIAKYAPDGACLWSKHYGNVSDDSFNGLAVDSQDNIYAIGSVSGAVDPASGLDFGFGPEQTFGGSDILLIKFAPNGSVIWHKIFGGTGADQGRAVARDSNDDLYIVGTTGFFGTGANFGGGPLPILGRPSAYLAKFHPDGSHVWSKSYGDGGNPSYAIDVSVASDGSPIMGGEFKGTANWGQGVIPSTGGFDSSIVKCDSAAGDTILVNLITGASDQRLSSISTAPGFVYAVGDFQNTANFGTGNLTANSGGSFYTVQYDNAGVVMHLVAFGTDANSPHAYGVASSATIGPIVVGEMVTGIDFGQGFLLGQGGNDVMLVSFNSDFNLSARFRATTAPGITTQWSRRGAPQADTGKAVAISGNAIYIVGACSAQFGLTGFEQNASFGATVIKPAKVIVSDTNVSNNGFWVRFNP